MKNLNESIKNNIKENFEETDEMISESYVTNDIVKAVRFNQDGGAGVLIGGTFKKNEIAKEKKARQLVESLGYNIIVSFEEASETGNNRNSIYGYIVDNDSNDCSCGDLFMGDIEII